MTPATEIARLRAALEPFARLQVPKKPQENAGAYSIRFADIENAQAALATTADAAGEAERLTIIAARELLAICDKASENESIFPRQMTDLWLMLRWLDKGIKPDVLVIERLAKAQQVTR